MFSVVVVGLAHSVLLYLLSLSLTTLSNSVFEDLLASSDLRVVVRVVIEVPLKNSLHVWLNRARRICLSVNSRFLILWVKLAKICDVLDDLGLWVGTHEALLYDRLAQCHAVLLGGLFCGWSGSD